MSDGATPGKGLHPSPARRCARLGAGDLAVSKPDLSAVQEHPVQGADGLEDSREVDWRSGEVDPVLGRQHHMRPSPEGLWADKEPKEGQLSLCDLRVFLPRACVLTCEVRSSRSSPKWCQWLSPGAHLVEVQGGTSG